MLSWSSCQLGEPGAAGTPTLPREAAAPRAAQQAGGQQGWQDFWCGGCPCTALPATPLCVSSPQPRRARSPRPGLWLCLILGPAEIPQTCAKHLCQEHLCGVHQGDFHELFASSGSGNRWGSATTLCPCPRHVPMLTRRAGLCFPLLTYATAWVQASPWYLLCQEGMCFAPLQNPPGPDLPSRPGFTLSPSASPQEPGSPPEPRAE